MNAFNEETTVRTTRDIVHTVRDANGDHKLYVPANTPVTVKQLQFAPDAIPGQSLPTRYRVSWVGRQDLWYQAGDLRAQTDYEEQHDNDGFG